MTHNWEEMGLDWEIDEVSRRAGPNNADKRALPIPAILPVVTDVKKYIAHFGEDVARGFISGGQSMRVMAQDVNRSMIEQELKRPAQERNTERLHEDIKNRVYDRARGVRAPSTGGTRTVIIRTLADGRTQWDGQGGFIGYKAAYLANAIESGIPREVAFTLAENLTDVFSDVMRSF